MMLKMAPYTLRLIRCRNNLTLQNNKNTSMTEFISRGLFLLFTTEMNRLITLTNVAGSMPFPFWHWLPKHWHVYFSVQVLFCMKFWVSLCLEVNMKSIILKGLVLLIIDNIIISEPEVLSWKRKTLKASLKCNISLI